MLISVTLSFRSQSRIATTACMLYREFPSPSGQALHVGARHSEHGGRGPRANNTRVRDGTVVL